MADLDPTKSLPDRLQELYDVVGYTAYDFDPKSGAVQCRSCLHNLTDEQKKTVGETVEVTHKRNKKKSVHKCPECGNSYAAGANSKLLDRFSEYRKTIGLNELAAGPFRNQYLYPLEDGEYYKYLAGDGVEVGSIIQTTEIDLIERYQIAKGIKPAPAPKVEEPEVTEETPTAEESIEPEVTETSVVDEVIPEEISQESMILEENTPETVITEEIITEVEEVKEETPITETIEEIIHTTVTTDDERDFDFGITDDGDSNTSFMDSLKEETIISESEEVSNSDEVNPFGKPPVDDSEITNEDGDKGVDITIINDSEAQTIVTDPNSIPDIVEPVYSDSRDWRITEEGITNQDTEIIGEGESSTESEVVIVTDDEEDLFNIPDDVVITESFVDEFEDSNGSEVDFTSDEEDEDPFNTPSRELLPDEYRTDSGEIVEIESGTTTSIKDLDNITENSSETEVILQVPSIEDEEDPFDNFKSEINEEGEDDMAIGNDGLEDLSDAFGFSEEQIAAIRQAKDIATSITNNDGGPNVPFIEDEEEADPFNTGDQFFKGKSNDASENVAPKSQFEESKETGYRGEGSGSFGEHIIVEDPVVKVILAENKKRSEQAIFTIEPERYTEPNKTGSGIWHRTRHDELREDYEDSDMKVLADKIKRILDKKHIQVETRVTVNEATQERIVVDLPGGVRLIHYDLKIPGGINNIIGQINSRIGYPFEDTMTEGSNIMTYIIYSDMIDGKQRIARTAKAICKLVVYGIRQVATGVFKPLYLSKEFKYYYTVDTTDDGRIADKDTIEAFERANFPGNCEVPHMRTIALIAELEPHINENVRQNLKMANIAKLQRGELTYKDLSMTVACTIDYMIAGGTTPDSPINVIIMNYTEALGTYIADGFGVAAATLALHIKSNPKYARNIMYMYYEMNPSYITSPTVTRYMKSGIIEPVDVDKTTQDLNKVSRVISKFNNVQALEPKYVNGIVFDEPEYTQTSWPTFWDPEREERIDWRSVGKRTILKTYPEIKADRIDVSDKSERAKWLLNVRKARTVFQPQVYRYMFKADMLLQLMNTVRNTSSGYWSVNEYIANNSSRVVNDNYFMNGQYQQQPMQFGQPAPQQFGQPQYQQQAPVYQQPGFGQPPVPPQGYPQQFNQGELDYLQRIRSGYTG